MHLFCWEKIHEFALINWEVFTTCNSEDKQFLSECLAPIAPAPSLTILAPLAAHHATGHSLLLLTERHQLLRPVPKLGFLELFPLGHVQEKKYYSIALFP